MINIIDEKGTVDKVELPDTNQAKVTRTIYNKARILDPLECKRDEAHKILMKIIKGLNITDDYSQQHTLKNRTELLKYLGISLDGKIPKGFVIDHIKERKTCVDDDDFKTINYYSNLRLLPEIDNLARNWLK